MRKRGGVTACLMASEITGDPNSKWKRQLLCDLHTCASSSGSMRREGNAEGRYGSDRNRYFRRFEQCEHVGGVGTPQVSPSFVLASPPSFVR